MNQTNLYAGAVEETPHGKLSQRLADNNAVISGVAEKILALCTARGIDPEDLRSALGLWCAGPDRAFQVDFRLSTLLRIARIMDVKITELLE